MEGLKWDEQKHDPQFEHFMGRKSSLWHVGSVHGWPMNNIEVSLLVSLWLLVVADEGKFKGEAEARGDCVECGFVMLRR